MRFCEILRSNAQWIDEVLQEFEIQCSMDRWGLARVWDPMLNGYPGRRKPQDRGKKRFPMSRLFYIREESYYSRFMESQCYNGYMPVTASVFIAVGLELTTVIGVFNIRFQCKNINLQSVETIENARRTSDSCFWRIDKHQEITEQVYTVLASVVQQVFATGRIDKHQEITEQVYTVLASVVQQVFATARKLTIISICN